MTLNGRGIVILRMGFFLLLKGRIVDVVLALARGGRCCFWPLEWKAQVAHPIVVPLEVA
jgi:hypothetical protein